MQHLCVCVGVWGGGGEGGVYKVQYGLCEIGELAYKQALLFEHQRSELLENARASGEAARGSRASTFHRRVFSNYSSSPNGLGINSP